MADNQDKKPAKRLGGLNSGPGAGRLGERPWRLPSAQVDVTIASVWGFAPLPANTACCCTLQGA